MAAPLCRAERGPATSIPYATSSGRSVARFRPYSTKIHATRMLNRRRRFALLCCAPIGSRRRDLRPRPTLRNERTSTRRAASFGASDSKVARRRVKRVYRVLRSNDEKKGVSSNIARRRRSSRWRGRESGCRLVRRYHRARTYLPLRTALTGRNDAQPRTRARLAGLATSTDGYMYVHRVEHGVIIVPVQLKKEA